MKYYVVVASDGIRLVVWGMGTSANAALKDSKQWLEGAELGEHEIHPITMNQRARIQAGQVDWPVSLAPMGQKLGRTR
jgi:hypothetical protein